MTTTSQNIEKTIFAEFTIAKDFEKYTVLITKPSPRSRLGIKVVCHYSFRRTEISKSIMEMNLFVDKFIDQKTKEEAAKVAKKLALKNARKDFKSPFEVGQILYHSYGYEQTNIEFFQITKIEGKTVFVREICQERTETGNMSGKTMPVKDDFLGEEVKKIVQIRVWNEKTDIYLHNLSTWDGRALYWSSYY
jgi:hypothetical protein